MSDELRGRICGLRHLADSLEVTLAQLAIAWILRNPRIACAIAGASKEGQLIESCAATEVALSDEVLQHIDEVLGELIETNPAKAGRPYDVPSRWKWNQ